MIACYGRDRCPQIIVFLSGWFLVIVFYPIQGQYIYQSLTVMSDRGNQYSPVNVSAQLISSSTVNSFRLCAMACNTNTLCRVFDYGAIVSQQCRLFEGDLGTLGATIPSSMPASMVGSIQITPSLFSQYGEVCDSVCTESRYLTCGSNSTCECMPHTYWNASAGICLLQSPILGASCEQGTNMCREDLNYTCLQFSQCGPLSVLSGTTIIDQNTVIQGSATGGLYSPYGITTDGVLENESLIVADAPANRVLHIKNADSNNTSASVLASDWTGGDGLDYPSNLFLDTQNASDLYVSEYGGNRVVLFSSMQITYPLPRVVAGILRESGSTLDKLDGATGITLDKQKNLYLAEFSNHRIMLWAPNATSGIVIVGSGTFGSDPMSLCQPNGIFLDQDNLLLYVADTSNHRIQLFHLNGTPPFSGITVAGGHDAGLGSNQLNTPYYVWVSKRTGAIYIADQSNNRIQRWNKGATAGVTIAGSPEGIADLSNTHLNSPSGLFINADETRMYVSDTLNNRIQRFDLI